MINIGLYYRVKEGHNADFENYFGNVVEKLRESDFGFIDGKIYREVTNPDEYMIYTEWKDTEGFAKFMKSSAFFETIEFGKTIIEGQPRHKIFNA